MNIKELVFYDASDPKQVSMQDLYALLSQKTKDYFVRCVLKDKNRTPISEVQGAVIHGGYSINADSDIRRTFSMDINLDKIDEFTEKQYFTHYIQVYLGIYSLLKSGVIEFKMGVYGFDTKNTNYNASTNTLSLSLVDSMGMLDAGHRGALYGASQFVIRAIDDDGKRLRNKSSVNGTPVVSVNGAQYNNSIANAMRGVLLQVGIKNAIIEDMGAYSVVSKSTKKPAKKADGTYYYDNSGQVVINGRKVLSERQLAAKQFFNTSGTTSTYRKINTKVEIGTNDSRYAYTEVPYDLEFGLGGSVLDEIIALRDLYEGYETYFDIDDVFHAKMIPTMYEDPVSIDAAHFNKCVISEDASTNIYDVKNVVEVWGANLQPDNYTTSADKVAHTSTASSSSDLYSVTLDDFVSETEDGTRAYSDGMVLGMIIPKNYQNATKRVNIRIISNNTTSGAKTTYPTGAVYDPSNGDSSIDAGMLEAGKTYLFQWSTAVNGWYYLGRYQVHAVAVLTNGKTSVAEIAKKYNCSKNAVYRDVNPNSPYVIEEIGDVITVLSGGDYANIYSDTLAASSARHELWKRSRRTDTITLQTLLIPFLDVNKKIEYTKQNEEFPRQYIVKSINGNLAEGTMSVDLMTFYPLYES